MQKGKRRLEQLTFKMIAAGAQDGLYGLTDEGKVFAWNQSKRYWVPMGMATPLPTLNVEDAK
jgi:hypothetical protein